jgi:hypothetical protein
LPSCILAPTLFYRRVEPGILTKVRESKTAMVMARMFASPPSPSHATILSSQLASSDETGADSDLTLCIHVRPGPCPRPVTSTWLRKDLTDLQRLQDRVLYNLAPGLSVCF